MKSKFDLEWDEINCIYGCKRKLRLWFPRQKLFVLSIVNPEKFSILFRNILFLKKKQETDHLLDNVQKLTFVDD